MTSSPRHYVLHAAHDLVSEALRLDKLNHAFFEYFKGHISLAPIDHSGDQHILDIGCGSGAWAITAASALPTSQVTAIDINPMPMSSVLPANCQFLQHDISTAFPFQREMFDVIHARLVLLHLPNVDDVLKRVSDILKPGGIVILEDPDDEQINECGVIQGVAGKSPLVSALHKLMRKRGSDPCIGRSHAAVLTTIGCFDEIHTTKLELPLTPIEDSYTDPSILEIANAWRTTYKSIARSLPALHPEISTQMVHEFIEQLDNPHHNLVSVLYLTWARKNAVAQ